jgi:hypothetical protein
LERSAQLGRALGADESWAIHFGWVGVAFMLAGVVTIVVAMVATVTRIVS